MKTMMTAAVVTAGACVAAPALGQMCDVSAADKYGWGENVGWLDFRDAGSPAGTGGLVVLGDHLGGMVWGENVGWISLGASIDALEGPYGNSNGTNYGVNMNPATGALSGLAWGENIGWINFSGGAMATPAKPATVDFALHRLTGYAWGENIGWINLDDSTHFVGLRCPSDFDGNGFVNGDDYDFFSDAFVAGQPEADFDHNLFVNGDDYDAFMAAFTAGC